MVALFYRSVSDGWRVGVAEAINLVKVIVTDVETGLQETVLPSDIFLIENQLDQNGEISPLLRMQDFPGEFLERSDAAAMTPSPILGVPTLIQLLRYRTTQEITPTCIGDNFSLLVGEETLPTVEQPQSATAEKAVLAWKASGKPQIVTVLGRSKPQHKFNVATATLNYLQAPSERRQELLAALRVLSAMTSTVAHSDQAIGIVQVKTDPDTLAFESVRLQHCMLNVDTIGPPCPMNFKVFAFLLYGFGGDERERLYICRKQEDFVCQAAIQDANIIASIRQEYLEWVNAMDILGISFATQLNFFTRIAAIVHLLEVEFYEDGSPSNVPALKNVAKLLQFSFNDCLAVFSSRRMCVAAAQLLYKASFSALYRRVNAVLDPEPHERSASITLITVPPVPSHGSDSLNGVVLAALYEDLTQCFIRSSDNELAQWQRAGFCTSPELQSAFDALDNFSLLKVLRGLGGVLATAQSRASLEQRKLALSSCAKHAKVSFDAQSGVVTIQHSFGARCYQFPKTTSDIAEFDSVHHESYSEMKQFLVENADVDTQEALYLMDQDAQSHADHIITEGLAECQPVLATLQSKSAVFWWIGCVELGAGFNGVQVEEQLKELPVRCAAQLRRLLPVRYVACNPEYIATVYKKLLSSQASDAFDSAETIFSSCGLPYLVTKDSVLVEARSLVTLCHQLEEKFRRAATVIQAFLRTTSCGTKLVRRISAWLEAIRSLQDRQNSIVEVHRSQTEHIEINQTKLIELLEEEAAARAATRSEYWTELSELQMAAQHELEGAMARAVSYSLKREERRIQTVMRQRHRNVSQLLEEQIQERLNAHAMHLDSIAEESVSGTFLSVRHAQRMQEAHDRLMRSQAQFERNRKQLLASVEVKHERTLRLKQEKEMQNNERREQNWIRHVRDRAMKERVEKIRNEVNRNLETQIVLQEIEHKMTRRVKEEISAYQRQQNEKLNQSLREERRSREEKMILMAKANERLIVKRELEAARRREEEAQHRRAQERKELSAQERERQVAERLRLAEERQEREMARALLKAQASLNKPRLYEHRLRGASVKVNPQDRPLSDSFVSAGGKLTNPRMLSEKTIEGLVTFHSQKIRAKSPYPYARGSVPSADGTPKRRGRQLSPHYS